MALQGPRPQNDCGRAESRSRFAGYYGGRRREDTECYSQECCRAATQSDTGERRLVALERLWYRTVLARRLERRRRGISKSRGRRPTKSGRLGKYRPRASAGGRYRRRPHGIGKGAGAETRSGARKLLLCESFERRRKVRRCAAALARSSHAISARPRCP